MASLGQFYAKGAKLMNVVVKNPHKVNVYKEYKRLTLKPVKRVQFKFDPFHSNALSIR
jgi:hypothetical protein